LGLLAGSSAAQTNVHDEPWFQVRDSDWTADPRSVSAMKVAVSVSLDDALMKSRPKGAPVHYWFQYGRASNEDDGELFFVGFPFPVPLNPDEMRQWIPEVCSITGRYSSAKKLLYEFSVKPVCPPRI
jgi:hypothetical protein